MIDQTRRIIKGTFFVRKIEVTRLQELLRQLNPHDELYPNENGDLSILRENKEIGFINLNEEEIELL